MTGVQTCALPISVLKRAVKDLGQIRFFTSASIERLLAILPRLPGEAFRAAAGGLRQYRVAHNVMSGRPSDEPLESIRWRNADADRQGVIWFGPTYPADGQSARRATALAERFFAEHGFECPITQTLVKPNRIIGILSILFDRRDDEEKARAYRLYDALFDGFTEAGLGCYRTSIAGMGHGAFYDDEKKTVLGDLKAVFDPNGIIAAGRYQIGTTAADT